MNCWRSEDGVLPDDHVMDPGARDPGEVRDILLLHAGVDRVDHRFSPHASCHSGNLLRVAMGDGGGAQPICDAQIHFGQLSFRSPDGGHDRLR